jgi:hypothetical protein
VLGVSEAVLGGPNTPGAGTRAGAGTVRSDCVWRLLLKIEDMHPQTREKYSETPP